MTSVPVPMWQKFAAAGPALVLLPLLAFARDPRQPAAAPPSPPSPAVQASLDGAHYEAVPIRRWRRDPASGRMRWVAVPSAEYKSMRWTFAAPPLVDTSAAVAGELGGTPPWP